MRIEGLSKTATSLKPEIITARALAPLPRLLDLAAPWFGPRVRGLFMKGRDARQEIEAARRRFNFTCELHPSMTAEESSIVEISGVTKRAKVKAR
jgi:16S rRNA (guanine527-N7)-methyltransferase